MRDIVRAAAAERETDAARIARHAERATAARQGDTAATLRELADLCLDMADGLRERPPERTDDRGGWRAHDLTR
ncbi:MAG: hypothetical protein OXP69_21215 [Spirochaetaceae bacterium]|nr:hypothetical protein [Spirochaetaceae bacterium]